MCTAVTYQTKDHYFGRTLDLYYSFRETVTVTPRHYPFRFRKLPAMEHHYALIGMAFVEEGFPLYYDAFNEKGLAMAGLNFPGNADFKPPVEGMDNVSPFEFIPWLLGQCASVKEARTLLSRLNLVNIPFSAQLPLSPLHWIIADREEAITVESVKEGLRVYDNPVGVLTNNPTFDFHMLNLCNYMNVTREEPVNHFSPKVDLTPYSLGMGSIGLPGDMSSASRFVRAAFTKLNSVSGDSESESVSQFFHILGSVVQQRGCTRAGGDRFEYTLYTSCCNTDKGIYYYTTYENSQITGVDMYREDLEGTVPVSYPLIMGQQIRMQN